MHNINKLLNNYRCSFIQIVSSVYLYNDINFTFFIALISEFIALKSLLKLKWPRNIYWIAHIYYPLRSLHLITAINTLQMHLKMDLVLSKHHITYDFRVIPLHPWKISVINRLSIKSGLYQNLYARNEEEMYYITLTVISVRLLWTTRVDFYGCWNNLYSIF